MVEWIQYRLLMRRLRAEIAAVAGGKQKTHRSEKIKTTALTACKAYGSIV